MARTSHGHHIPGTSYIAVKDYDGPIMRCGGVGLCKVCSAEAGTFTTKWTPVPAPPTDPQELLKATQAFFEAGQRLAEVFDRFANEAANAMAQMNEAFNTIQKHNPDISKEN